MVLRVVLAIIVVFVAWAVLDFIIHGVILQSTYAATAELWRPVAEMKMGLAYLVTLVASACFVGIYALLVQPKSIGKGLTYALLFGVATGAGMGFGSYCYMPIPFYLAGTWFLATLVESLVAGLLAGLIVKRTAAA